MVGGGQGTNRKEKRERSVYVCSREKTLKGERKQRTEKEKSGAQREEPKTRAKAEEGRPVLVAHTFDATFVRQGQVTSGTSSQLDLYVRL